ncbi:MAG: 2-C-methyl-D-erythritol 2,4-cyclodiphosphate synthase [Deltaproteobacteria bacterium]|nr:MAG: 2-C-methyl-D-erythritol 2,4-cyclodiphosphate synthase [Deltaproteobacteria bacterium]
MRLGIGYDVHAFSEKRDLILGGVKIPYHLGLRGHSDADVLLHAICDAILGALSKGDIGKHFPDTDNRYKGISSTKLLSSVVKLMRDEGYTVSNLDCIIIAQEPKLSPYMSEMISNISRTLKIPPGDVNVKATTTEFLGFEGKREGIAAYAVVLLKRF